MADDILSDWLEFTWTWSALIIYRLVLSLKINSLDANGSIWHVT